MVGNLPESQKPHGEIVYSENGGMDAQYDCQVLHKRSEVMVSGKEDEGFQIYPYSDKIVGGQEDLSVMMFRGTVLNGFIWYKYHLDEMHSVRDVL